MRRDPRRPHLRLLLLATLALTSLTTTGCDTEDIAPGSKGFRFDRTGILALYSGGKGLVDTELLGPGTHFLGAYDELRVVNCKDAHEKEQVSVLTKSDITVTVDLRITYSADCRGTEPLKRLINEVSTSGKKNVIEPGTIYKLYVLPVVRESLRNNLAKVTIEDVKSVRTELRDALIREVTGAINSKKQPVIIKILAVSDIRLPKSIVEKNRQIELARQEAEQEREKRLTAKVRLERELFEAQQERKVKKEQAEKEKDIKIIAANAEKEISLVRARAARDARVLEAEGIKALRAQLTADYLKFISIQQRTEVAKENAKALGRGTVYYMGADFLVPPGENSKRVSVSK